MFGSASERVISILGFLFLVLVAMTESRTLDCTKFVFAPKCRGVAAKRNNAFNFPQLSSHRSASKTLPSLDDNWDSDTKDTLDLLKGVRQLMNRLNEKPPTFSGDDSRYWRTVFQPPMDDQ